MKNKTKRNKKINIKDDFYNYYNLKWIKKYQIPMNENSVNLFSILQKIWIYNKISNTNANIKQTSTSIIS